MVRGMAGSYEKQLQMIRMRFETYDKQMRHADPANGVLGSHARLELMNRLKDEINESDLFKEYPGLYMQLRATKFNDGSGKQVPALAEDFSTRRAQFAHYLTLLKHNGKMPVAQAKPNADPAAPKPPTPRQIAKRLARQAEVKPGRRSVPKPGDQPRGKMPAKSGASGFRVIGKSNNAGVRAAEQDILRRMGY